MSIDNHPEFNVGTNNRGKSLIDLDNYRNDSFSIYEYSLKEVMDDVILVEYVDTPDGRDVMRNGILIPTSQIKYVWRIAQVHLAGPNCKQAKVGDKVCFPSDKGIPVANMNIIDKDGEKKCIKNACFLSEARIFGIIV